MTPERLQEIRNRYDHWADGKLPTMHDGLAAISDAVSLLTEVDRLTAEIARLRAGQGTYKGRQT